ncbi:MAG TPA: cytochrome c/FTR1 family iron permease, partial [Gemmatimonadaceae bacterium]|nr:cytochrome c/FTR1 family iron permease [Gemmatimonadaceae bacterium]
EHPVKRVANIVTVALEEYAKGIDEHGRLISAQEYQEAVDFLADARHAAERLPGPGGDTARVLLDSIVAAIGSKRPPSELAGLHHRFDSALGSEAALELPNGPIDVAAGRAIYEKTCASCHGMRGMGDGPAAAALNPKPPAIGSAKEMRERSPALLYRIMSVGIAGTPMTGFANQLTPNQRWNVVSYLTSLRASTADVAEGEGLFAQRCTQCHGVLGGGETPLTRALSRLPPEIGAFGWQGERSDAQLAAVVRDGMTGSPMPPSRDLTPAQVQSVVAYLRTLPLHERSATAIASSARDSSADAAAANALSLLEQSLTAYRAGRPGDASDRAFDAYLAFEPIETPARARDPGVVSSMEKLFADFKAAVRANDLRGAERARDAIEATMPKVVDLTQKTGSGSEAFVQSFLIILREGFEAILVIGAVVAFLLKTGHRERLRDIWWGVALGLLASAVTAVVLKTVLGAMPASREIIEGLTLLVAVAVLFSVSYWLISRVEAAKWQQFIREKVNNALAHGGGKALAFVAFLAVYREGAETALFYQALFDEGPRVALPITLGLLLGFAALAVIFVLFYRYGVRIPLRPFFSVTSVLLYYMAFVFMGKGVRELQEGNAMPITLIPGFPHVEALGLYPTWQTVLAQVLLLALFVFALAKTFWPKRSVALPTVPADAKPATDIASELAALRQDNERLRARLAALEESVAQGVQR